MTTYIQIFENNKRWVAEKKATDNEFFEKLAEGQDPDFLYIGCRMRISDTCDWWN